MENTQKHLKKVKIKGNSNLSTHMQCMHWLLCDKDVTNDYYYMYY